MKTYISSLIFTLLAFGAYGQSLTPSEIPDFTEEINALMQEYKTMGLAVAIVRDSTTVFAKGYGYRDLEKQLPVTPESVFGIGSVTKAFTAGILGIQEEEGKLSLSDRPGQYIPELKFYSPVMDSTVRIRHLLSHATGVSNMTSECSAVLFCDDNPEALVQRSAHIKPVSQVGESFQYSNYNYALAGVLGERVSGKTWQHNLREFIFSPLAMKHTYPSAETAIQDEDFAPGYGVYNEEIIPALPQKIGTLAAAGEIHSSVKDMAEWLKVWLNEGRGMGQQILPSAYVQEACSAQQIMDGQAQAPDSGRSYFHNYGYGWMSSDYYGFYKVEHSGGVSGYSANVVFFPTENTGIIVLSNQSSSGISQAVTRLYEEKLLSIKRAPGDVFEVNYVPAYPLTSDTIQTKINKENPSTVELTALTGKYRHPGFGTVKISLKNNVLFAEFPFVKCRLEHQRDNLFIEHHIEEKPLVIFGPFMRFNFQSDASGNIKGLDMNFSAEGVLFERVSLEKQ